MEREFYTLVLRWLMAISARFFMGERHPEGYELLKTETQNFIKRCQGGE